MFHSLENIPSSAVIAIVTVIWSQLVYRCLSGKDRAVFWFVLVVVPFFMPVIAIGYVYANWSLALVRFPALNYWLYCTIMVLRLVPVAVLIYSFTTRVTTCEGHFCLSLLRMRTMNKALFIKYLLTGFLPRFMLAFTVVFLLAFNEFEVASLMSVSRWTVRLFDAHAQGLLLYESLKLSLVPCLVELGMVVAALSALKSFGILSDTRTRLYQRTPVWIRVMSGLYLLLAWGALVIVPLVYLLKEGGFRFGRLLSGDMWMSDEILVSLVFAAVVSVILCATANILFIARESSRKQMVNLVIAMLIFLGLFSTLPLALVICALFQLPVLIWLRDTPFPLLLGMGVAFLPYALLFRWILQPVYQSSSRFLVSQSTRSYSSDGKLLARELWRYRYSPYCWLFFFIFLISFFDLTLSAILLPPGMTALAPRLHELMHYGHTMTLSATVLLSLLVPAVFFCVIMISLRGVLWYRLGMRKK